MLGDTSVEWAMWAAEIAYFTRVFSPQSELMRRDIVNATYHIVRKRYQPSLKKKDFWQVVVDQIKKLQYTEREEAISSRVGGIDNPNNYFNRSINDLFDTTRKDT